MPRQIQGSQTDFSYGEIDVSLKRADQHPARKAGLRQMSNARILNSGSIQDRPGRSAVFPIQNGCTRIEKITMSPGNAFTIGFGPGRIRITNPDGSSVANFTTMGSGAALPWASQQQINSIGYAIFGLSIYITFGHTMRPQVITWDGNAGWSIANYVELMNSGQKRTPFYRISPQGITLLPGAQTGSGVTLVASAPLFTAAHIGTRMRFVNRQFLITAVGDSTHATITIEESLPGAQNIAMATDPRPQFSIGDVVIGTVSGSKGIVTAISSTAIEVQLITTNSTLFTNFLGQQFVVSFVNAESVVGPAGSIVASSVAGITAPQQGCALWDDEIMNDFRGYPGSCFVDQFRLGFCDFPAVPNGIGWSAINSPLDMYVDVNGDNAMFELAPGKVRVLYVAPGAESSEFVFCDTRLYYIPISPTNPLKPGSVQFQILSGDGCAQVQPRLSQEVILYANAGQNSMMAVVATGAYYRPFNTKNLSEFHAHLFSGITAIAVPTADGTFNERYAYVLGANGSLTVGKYNLDELTSAAPKIGWGPWSGAGTINWVDAWNAEVHFTSSYFGTGIYEVLDDSQYLDCALPVNAAPAAFAPPAGMGPLWFIPSQTVILIDQVTRVMGTYQIDVNGFIVAQFNGGENLAIASLVAGQPWTMITEPFAPNAQPGVDMHQRMTLRQIALLGVSVINSSGFMFASLFSSKQTATTPPLGTIQQSRRVPAWNVGDDVTKPPTLREYPEFWTPPGSSYDPRVAIIKDAPGPLMIEEIAMEISL